MPTGPIGASKTASVGSSTSTSTTTSQAGPDGNALYPLSLSTLLTTLFPRSSPRIAFKC